MPRISIIIAHQIDQRLEDTILSVLENRPRDCEVIVAHDGSYADPYQLADEVLFVETDSGSSLTSKLNEGLYAACAPVVHILSEGVTVSDGWCDGPIQIITRYDAAAVAPLIEVTGIRAATYAGLDENRLVKRGLNRITDGRIPDYCAGPLLLAGFYARKTLLNLGGFLESVDSSVADVDMALNLLSLDLDCEVDASSIVHATSSHISTARNAGALGDLASILTAHNHIPTGLVAGLKSTTSKLLANLFNPSQWAPAISWGMSQSSNRLHDQVADRLANWHKSQVTVAAANVAQRKAA